MSDDQRDTSTNQYEHKLDKRTFECLSSLRSVKFGFLKFGSLCNASESNAFTSARCEINNIINKESKTYTLDFETLFKLGLDLLEKLRCEKKPTLGERNTRAIEILEAFIEQKVIHEASLTEILLDKDKKYSEADFTVTLAEHLFKLLAPERHYVIDKGARGKNSCKCKIDTCEKEKHFGNTRIGHKDVWHGSIDLVLISNEDSVRWRSIIEVKRSLSLSKFAVMDQAIAQTIVFSFLQKGGSPNIFIPNILISPKEFRVIMYNAEYDLLICSQPLNLFTKQDSTGCLNFSSLLVLWMVLHYKTFLKDVKQVVQEDCIQDVKADFNAKTNTNIYWTNIKSSVNKFPTPANKGYFPDLESLEKGENVSFDELVSGVDQMNLGDVPGGKTKSKNRKSKKDN